MRSNCFATLTIVTLLVGSLASGWQGSVKLTDSQVEVILDRAVSDVSSGSYEKGMASIAGLMMEARRRVGAGNLRDLLGEPKPLLDRQQILNSLRDVRGHFLKKNDLAALQICSQLGMSLAALTTASNQEQGLITPTASAQTAVQAYQSKRIAEAQLAAERVIGASNTGSSNHLYDQAIHSANTVLGLIALDQGDAKKAAEHLLRSVEGKTDASFRNFIPNFQLAEKLWMLGDQSSVKRYVAACGQVSFSHPRTRDAIAGFARDLESGTFASFGSLARTLR